jgi:hypothetical protein
VLAIDLHPRRFGYVVVERPDRLLDWGARGYRHKGDSTDGLIRQFRSLLELWRPSILVLGQGLNMPQGRRQRTNRLLKLFVNEAKHNRLGVRILKKRPEVVEAKTLTKYENARRAAEQFSVLRWKMPPQRKPWESENYRMSMFTAATLAIAQLSITPPLAPANHAPPPVPGFCRPVTPGGV